MDVITLEWLKQLARPRESVGVSLYMQFNDGTQGDLKNPARLREMLDSAHEVMASGGIKPEIVTKMLRPGYELASSEEYWRDHYGTLAVFVFADEFSAYKLPFVDEEKMVVSRYPYLKPILREYQLNKKLYVLILAAGGSRLLKFDRYNHLDVTPAALEKSSKEYADYFQIERESTYHMKRAGSGKTKQGLITHGHDNTEQLNKLRAEEYARIIAKEVKKVVGAENLPLILAGVKSAFLVSPFRASYGGEVIEDYIQVETAPTDIAQIQSGVRRILQDMERKEESESLEAASHLQGTGYSEDAPERIVKMALESRVDALFINDEQEVFGIVDVANDVSNVRVTNNPVDENLSNVAAATVWDMGGRVFYLSDEELQGKPMMASLRY